MAKPPNDTRARTAELRQVQAKLNADAHRARMEIYHALYNQCEHLLIRFTIAANQPDSALETGRLHVMLTEQRAILHDHVERMSKRIKVRS